MKSIIQWNVLSLNSDYGRDSANECTANDL